MSLEHEIQSITAEKKKQESIIAKLKKMVAVPTTASASEIQIEDTKRTFVESKEAFADGKDVMAVEIIED